jgi:hypothetical protein
MSAAIYELRHGEEATQRVLGTLSMSGCTFAEAVAAHTFCFFCQNSDHDTLACPKLERDEVWK